MPERAEHHGGGSAAVEVPLQGLGPGPPRHQLPAVEEDGQVPVLERTGDTLHRRVVEGVVADEDVEFSGRVQSFPSLCSPLHRRWLVVERWVPQRCACRERPGGKPPGPPKGKRTKHKGSEVLGETETEDVEPVDGVVPVAVGRAEVLRSVVPGATAHHTPAAVAATFLFPSRAVLGRRTLVAVVPAVLHPFPDVAGGVIEPERVRLEAPDRPRWPFDSRPPCPPSRYRSPPQTSMPACISSPHQYRVSVPARAAYSHSASVGSR